MAKGKSFLGLKRGQAAGLVYSVGRNAAGRKQQVVRGVPEQVANPQSTGQAVQRTQLGAAARIASLFSSISDHAVEGVPFGQPNRSAFIKMVLKDYIGTAPACVYRGESGVFVNYETTAVPISKGSLGTVYVFGTVADSGVYDGMAPAVDSFATVATWTPEVLAELGLQDGDIITIFGMSPRDRLGAMVGKAPSVQMVVKSGEAPKLVDGTAIATLKYKVYRGAIWVSLSAVPGLSTVIAVVFERRTTDGYLRSTSYFTQAEGGQPNYETAVNSYKKQSVSSSAYYGPDYLDGSAIPVSLGE